MFAKCATPTRKKFFGYDSNADSKRLTAGLAKLGYDGFRPGQEKVVRAVLSGRDVMFLFPTGGGKSLCYQLPITVLPAGQVALVVSPLIALMQDQLKNAAKLGIPTKVLNSTLKEKERVALLGQLEFGFNGSDGGGESFKLLYVTPEQVSTQNFRNACSNAVKEGRLAYVAVDEAHCISSWGHDFRPAYRNLGNLRKICPGVPVMACTATATNQVKDDIKANLYLKNPEQIALSFNRPNLTYAVKVKEAIASGLCEEEVTQGIVADMAEEIRNVPGNGSGIIYAFKKKDCTMLATCLSRQGIPAKAYHGGMKDSMRADVQKAWGSGLIRVLVATVAFGMGVDKGSVRFVFHYNPPKTLENYYQESGRAGRDGNPARCVLYFSHEDISFLRWTVTQALAPKNGAEFTEHQEARMLASNAALSKIVDYCKRKGCRRVALLDHFGEQYYGGTRPCCDWCDARETVLKMLSVHNKNGTMQANVCRRVGGGAGALAKMGGGKGKGKGGGSFMSAGDMFRKDLKFEYDNYDGAGSEDDGSEEKRRYSTMPRNWSMEVSSGSALDRNQSTRLSTKRGYALTTAMSDLERRENALRRDESPVPKKRKPPPTMQEVVSSKWIGFCSVLKKAAGPEYRPADAPKEGLSDLRIASLLRELEAAPSPPLVVIKETDIGNILKNVMKRWRDDGHSDAAGRAKALLRKWRDSSSNKSSPAATSSFRPASSLQASSSSSSKQKNRRNENFTSGFQSAGQLFRNKKNESKLAADKENINSLPLKPVRMSKDKSTTMPLSSSTTANSRVATDIRNFMVKGVRTGAPGSKNVFLDRPRSKKVIELDSD